MIVQEVLLKYGEKELDQDEKVITQYGRIKDGSVIHLVRKLTAHDTIKLASK